MNDSWSRGGLVHIMTSAAMLVFLYGCATGNGAHRPSVFERLQLADSHYARGERQEARALYREILERDPDNAPVEFRLGVLEYARGDLEAALRHFERVRTLDPGHRRSAYNISVIHLQRAHLSLRRYLAVVDADNGRSEVPGEDPAALRNVLREIETFRVGADIR